MARGYLLEQVFAVSIYQLASLFSIPASKKLCKQLLVLCTLDKIRQ
jgi:hypothetical protein